VPAPRSENVAISLVFVTIISAPGLIQAVAEIRNQERPGVLDVFFRAPTTENLHDYEKSLEDASLVARRSRPWMQYFLFRVFGDAGEKALLGRDGWLFYRPGVQYVVERPTPKRDLVSPDPIIAIRSFRDQLASRGVRLIVVPVPNKECIYPERVAKRAKGKGVLICSETRRLMDELKASDIDAVDLFEVYRAAKLDPTPAAPGPLYLVQDSHWSPGGARLAAWAVARRVLERGDLDAGPRAYDERRVSVQRIGDVLEMLQVPQLERSTEPERISCSQVVDNDTGKPYRDAPDSRVLVLGDSFLRIYERDEPGSAGFIAHLARELGQPVTSLVNDGGASTMVRQELARRPRLLTSKKVVIWEFVERDIRDGALGWQIIHVP
jgi:hypothetical protein